MRKMFSHWVLEPVYSLTSPLSEFLLMLLSVHAESCLTLIICFFSLSFFFYFLLFLHRYVCYISLGGNLHEMSKATFWKRNSENIINLCRPQWLRRSGGYGFNPCPVATFFCGDLIMKYFLQSFSPFRSFTKGSCQFLVKEYTQYCSTI